MKIVSYFKLPVAIEDELKTLGEYVNLEGLSYEIKDICEATIIIGNLPPHLLKHCKKLKFLQLIFAGSDGYKDYVCDDYEICNASGTFGASIAEHLIMYTLMLFRSIPNYMDQQKQHLYHRIDNNKMIYGSTFMICGCGDIGTQFAKRIKALGGYTIGIKRRKCVSLPYFDEIYTEDRIEEHLHRADVIALCLPKNDTTDHFLSDKRMQLMKKDAILLNVGRGNAVDTQALITFLKNKEIGGAALDVFEEEPLPISSELWDIDNLIITPHVSGTFANPYTFELFYEILKDNINRFKNNKPLKNVIDKESGYRKEVS